MMELLPKPLRRERKRRHYARPGHGGCDELSLKVITFAVEGFGRLGEEEYEFINELATPRSLGYDNQSRGVFEA